MFSQLPETIKQQVIRYLEANNFPAAKKLHDEWFRQNIEKSLVKEQFSEAH